MIIKSATIFCLIALTYSATIRERDIPVEVRYDDGVIGTGIQSIHNADIAVSNEIPKTSDADVINELKTPQEPVSSTQLEEKPQTEVKVVEVVLPVKKLPDDVKIDEVPQKLSDEPKKEEIQEQKQEEQKLAEVPSEQSQPPKSNDPTEKPEPQMKDVPAPEESPQSVNPEPTLMQEEPKEVMKNEEENNKEKPQIIPADDSAPSEQNQTAPPEQNQKEPEKVQEQENKQDQVSPIAEQPNLLMRGNPTDIKSEVADSVQEKALPVDESGSARGESILSQAQEIISNGLQKLKDSIAAEGGPKPEQWESLEKKVREYFSEEKRRLELKQDNQNQNQNVIQSIITNFQTMTNDFMQNIQGNRNNTQADEQQGGGPLQGITNFIQNGFNNIQQSISNLGGGGGPSTSNTVLGDGTTTAAPGIFQNFVSGIQNFVSNIGGGGQQAAQPGEQVAGESSQPSQPQGPAQQVIQQIGNTINSIIRPQGQQTVSEGSSSTQSPNIIQTIGQNINNAIQNINPFRPQGGTESSSQPPAQNEDDQGAKKPQAQEAVPSSSPAPPEKLPEKPVQSQPTPSQLEPQPSQSVADEPKPSQPSSQPIQSPVEVQPQQSNNEKQPSPEKKEESNEKRGM